MAKSRIKVPPQCDDPILVRPNAANDEFNIKTVVSKDEAEALARGEVPAELQDFVISILLAMGQTVGERSRYLADR